MSDIIIECPRCGNPENVTRGKKLVACGSCASYLADMAEAQEQVKDKQYDWPRTLLNIKHSKGLKKQSDVAWALKLNPNVLSMVKKGKRAMPESAMKIIKEHFSEHIVLNSGIE